MGLWGLIIFSLGGRGGVLVNDIIVNGEGLIWRGNAWGFVLCVGEAVCNKTKQKTTTKKQKKGEINVEGEWN